MRSLYNKQYLKVALIVVILISIFLSCEKPERIAKITTLDYKTGDISYTTATLKGIITDLGSQTIEDFGIIISKNASFLNQTPKAADVNPSKDTFHIEFTLLERNTTYFYKAYVTVNTVTTYGTPKQFKTKDTEAPTVTAGSISNVSLTSANLSGEVTSDGGEPVTKRGLCWGTNANPTITNCLDTTINGSGTGTFTGLIHGLTAGTQYYVRAYAINAKGTGYNSADVIFTTIDLPVAVTIAANPVLNTTATLNGTVNAKNLSTVVTFEYGLSTSYGQTATATQSPVTGSVVTNVSASLTGLTQGTLYHFRVKAVSSAGTVTGSDMTFTTLEPPVATSLTASPVANTTATLNGTVNAKNSSTTVIFEYGTTTAYGQTVNATPGTVTGNSPASVSANITGLTQGTTYHFRVKASSAGGSSDGVDQIFTTTQPPAAVTGTADNITSVSAMLHGTINALNSSTSVTFEYGPTTSYGTTVTATQSPVTGNTVTNVSATISGLSPSTTYHFRVVGTSIGGTRTGNDGSFTTLTPPPIVSDFDGHLYDVITIGSQDWLQSNLKTTHFNNGEEIPYVTDNIAWSVLTTSAISWYGNDAASFKDQYGGLYNWYTAVDVRNVCPAGWHVPTNTEFNTLTSYLGGTAVAGGKLKEIGTTHWTSPNTNATNESGFTSLGSGYRHPDGRFFQLGISTMYWLQPFGAANTNFFYLLYTEQSVIPYSEDPINLAGYSIRCIRGELPLAETNIATAVAPTSVTLNGKVNPNGATTTITIEYGTSTSYGTEVSASPGSATGALPVAISANLTGLTSGTKYHYRVKAVNSAGTTYGRDRVFATIPLVADINGNVYNTVTIGTQTWMKENLKATTYNDGTNVPNITDNATWNVPGGGGYCDYNNNPTNSDTYGRLYNFYAAADARNLCPTDWHVATDADWTALSVYLGGTDFAGGKMKEAGIVHWADPNVNGTNESGFTALPGGFRNIDGSYNYLTSYSYWWSSTADVGGFAFSIGLWAGNGKTIRGRDWSTYGFSVRCIKD